MQKWSFGTLFWLVVALATFNNNFLTAAISVGKDNQVSMLLGEENNRLSLDSDDHKADQFNAEEVSNEQTILDEILQLSNQEGTQIEADDNEDVDYEALRKQLRKNRITDILVGCFFFVAAVWLLLATCYSVILLVLLQLQARGELDIYDENLGRVEIFNGKFTLHFGCILRRYAVQLEEVSLPLAKRQRVL